MSDTSREHRDTIHRLAADSFAHHVVEEVAAGGDTRAFRCARPGTVLYGFRVVVWPGAAVVAGDIGDTLFQHSDRDTLAWLRGAHTDYLLGKVRNPHKVFMPGDAEAFLREQLAEMEKDDPPYKDGGGRDVGSTERTEELRVALAVGEIDEHRYHEICQNADIDDPPDCRDYSGDHLWAVEALQWFIKAWDAKEKAA